MGETIISSSMPVTTRGGTNPPKDKNLTKSSKITVDKSIDIPKTSLPPKIDGKLDDPVWQNAAVITNFTQFIINEGQSATEETIVRTAYDDENIYFGIRCFDSDPSKIKANLSNRDEILADDWIAVSLDTFDSKRRSFIFGVNPYGIQIDALNDENDLSDFTWDAIFESRGTIDDKGWAAELSIPLKSLRFPNKKTQDWGLLIIRYLARKNEKTSWPPLTRKINGSMQQAGKIKGIKVKPTHTFEVTPYVAGGYQEELDQLNNKWKGMEHFDAGIDLKYGLSSNLILDLTVNPDFSQIEADADQIEINRRYELYFQEKRPFFLESSEKFKTPIEVFYSRRIADPLAGAKITGTLGSYNFGFVSTWDKGRSGDPDAFLNILRIQKDLENQSNVGFIFTDKEFKEGNSYKYNRVFGVDSRIRFLDHYTMTLQGLGSWTTKESAGQNREVSDPAVYANLERNDGTLLTRLSYLDIAPNFDAQTGFMKRKDIRKLSAYAQYTFRPETWIRHWGPYTCQEVIFDHKNYLTDRWHQFGIDFDFEGNTFLQAFYGLQGETWRGAQYQKNNFGLFVSNDLSKYISGGLFFIMGESLFYDMDHLSDPEDRDDSFLGWKYLLSVQADIKPTSNLSIELSTNWENFRKSMNGEEVYDIWLLRGKVNYQISSSLFIRTIAQSNTRDKTLSLNALFGYVPSAGTVFYLGYNEDLQLGDDPHSIGRTIFAKFAYHWQY